MNVDVAVVKEINRRILEHGSIPMPMVFTMNGNLTTFHLPLAASSDDPQQLLTEVQGIVHVGGFDDDSS